MLTATYALVTLTVEQKKMRSVLTALQQQIRAGSARTESIDRTAFESILYQLVQFDESCRWRNLELYVIPALRSATGKADELIAELEAFSSAGENLLREVRASLWRAFNQSEDGVVELSGAMDAYCHHLLQRLAKEEQELLPLAQRVISSKDWFDLAAQFISHDADNHAHKPILPKGRNAIGTIKQVAATA